MKYFRFNNSRGNEGESSPNNCFINSVLQVYLRLPKISKALLNLSSKVKYPPTSADGQLFEIIRQAFENCENKNFSLIPIIDMNSFRIVLGSEYSTTFPYNSPGDAHSFCNYFNNDPFNSALQISYLESLLNDEMEMDAQYKTVDYISFPVYKAIPIIEKFCKSDRNKISIDSFKEHFTEMFPLLLSATLKSSNVSSSIMGMIKDIPCEYKIEYNLLTTPPKTLCFAFEYKSYFRLIESESLDGSDLTFTIRPVFSQILPYEFSLDKIFTDRQTGEDSDNDLNSDSDEEIIKPSDYTCKLFAIVGYYGFHYMTFINYNDEFYLCDDINTKKLSNVNDKSNSNYCIGPTSTLFSYLERSKVIPYLVFYTTSKQTPSAKSNGEETPKIKQIFDPVQLETIQKHVEIKENKEREEEKVKEIEKIQEIKEVEKVEKVEKVKEEKKIQEEEKVQVNVKKEIKDDEYRIENRGIFGKNDLKEQDEITDKENKERLFSKSGYGGGISGNRTSNSKQTDDAVDLNIIRLQYNEVSTYKNNKAPIPNNEPQINNPKIAKIKTRENDDSDDDECICCCICGCNIF